MSHARAVTQTFKPPTPGTVSRKLFKADHPRATDSCIDYFGGRPAADISPENDPCGEGFLDAFARQGGAPDPGATDIELPKTRERKLTELLFIVARDRRELWDCWTQWFSGIPHVRVILDRRRGERRRQVKAHQPERRQTDRRRQAGTDAGLRSAGFEIIRRERAAASPPVMP